MRFCSLLMAMVSVAWGTPSSAATGAVRPNILLVVADDLGTTDVAAYRESAFTPRTPTLDRLARSGVMFRNAWSNPVCSPTRATIQTGRFSFRTGIGFIVDDLIYALQPGEQTIPEAITATSPTGYANATIGKWHLGNANVGGLFAPNTAGYQHFVGNLNSMNECCASYFDWGKVTDGIVALSTTYNTTSQVDDALAWINSQNGPWFLHLSFNAPHFPYHAPPANLHTVNLNGAPPPSVNPRPYFEAMVEAMDTELGRLLATLPPRVRDHTYVIFVGDNGTPSEVLAPPIPSFHGKPSLFEAGINVPLIVTGPGVVAGECAGLVNTTDIFSTIVELAGGDLSLLTPAGSLDSISLVPYLANPLGPSMRAFAFAEIFDPNGVGPFTFTGQAIRNTRYKYIRSSIASTPLYVSALFDLNADPNELNNLLFGMGPPQLTPNQQHAFDQLTRALDDLLASGG